MTLKLNIGKKEYIFNESRIKKMVSSSTEKEAIKMGLWDKFAEFFRKESKAESLKLLYSVITAQEDGPVSEPDRLKRFVALKALAVDDRVSDFTIRRSDGHGEHSMEPCNSYVLSIGDQVIAKGKAVENQECQAIGELIASHVNLSSEAHIRAGIHLGGKTYGDVYKHRMPTETWIYKLKKKEAIRGKPETVARTWNAVFRKIYNGKFAHLAVAEAVPLSDGSCGPYALKAPFVEGDRPDRDYDPSLLEKELKSIGWYMHDNNRDNVRIIKGYAIPIDFDLIEPD